MKEYSGHNGVIIGCKEYTQGIKQLINRLVKEAQYRDDLYQEVYLILLEMDETKLKDLHFSGGLMPFVNRIITNQFNSKSSEFYRKYKRWNINRSDLTIHTDNDDDED